jgi:tripartite ATP-independent transporter DctM subunit
MGLEWLAVLMFLGIFAALALGYPVGPTFAGVAILFAALGIGLDIFDFRLFRLLQNRWFGTMSNFSYLAIPYFVYMGTVLEKSGLAEDLLETVGLLFGRVRGGLAVGVVLVGALLGATTGVVAASVITMGVISLPVMLRNGYDTRFATGVIASSGTLAQVIPPATVLIILADQLGVPLGNLFVGAIIPGLLLVVAFIIYCLVAAALRPRLAPAVADTGLRGSALLLRVVRALLPTLALIFAVLGSIYLGLATPSEAGAVGSLGALLLAAAYRKLNFKLLKDAAMDTVRITSLVVLILFGSTMFTLVFDGLGGTRLMVDLLSGLPGGYWGFLAVSMIAVFLLGIFLEFIEICFITLPIFVPAAQLLGIDLTWFGILMALNLYTAFISPPVGFTLFYLSSVAPPSVKIGDIFRGVIPFMVVSLIVLAVVVAFPETVTYLTTRSAAGFVSP